MKKIILDKNILEFKYYTENKSLIQIANDLNVSKRTVLRSFRQHNIKTRTVSEGTKLRSKSGKDNWMFGKKFLGKNGFNWKGGLTSLSQCIRCLKEYSDWRTEVFKRDNFTCQECGATKCYLEADHIKPFSLILREFLNRYNNLSPVDDTHLLLELAIRYDDFWNLDNGKTLCRPCHEKTDTYAHKSVRKM